MRTVIMFLVFLAEVSRANPQIDLLFSVYDKPRVPGAAVTVIREGKVIYAKGYGLEDLESSLPVTTKTNFRLASVSKQFTAMAILILVNRGQLSLEASLVDIFPDFPAYGKKITIRHLLNHTGGLRDYEDLIPSGQSEQVLDEDVLEMMKNQSSGYFLPGSRYQYSNGGYCVLAEVVQKVSGMRCAEFMKVNLFERLGMKGSLAFEKSVSVVENRAYGYTGSGGGFVKTDQSVTSATIGDGGVYTSVGEMFLWDQALSGEDLVSESLLQKMFTPGTLNDGSKIAYGFGWMLDTYRGLKRQHHTGSTVGFRTSIMRFPEKKFTVVVLINRAGSEPWTIGQRISDMFLF